MYEVVIKYKNKKTLKALTALGEYLGFTVSEPIKTDIYYVNGVPVKRGDPTIDMDGLHDIFENFDMDPKALRESAWQRPFN